ncbi:MAG: RNA pseudouridine synthase, partial [Candidatus Nanopelagicaceae bacterium]
MSEREKRVLLIDESLEGERVDVALAGLLGLSRSAVADLLNAGSVLQGKKPLSKSDRVKTGDRIQVLMPAEIDPLDFTRVVSEELDVI